MLHVCQQLASVVEYLERTVLLLVIIMASDLPLRINAVLLSSA